MNVKEIKKLLFNVDFGDCKVLDVEHVETDNKLHYEFNITMDRQVFPHGGSVLKYRVRKRNLAGAYKRGMTWYHDGDISNLER